MKNAICPNGVTAAPSFQRTWNFPPGVSTQFIASATAWEIGFKASFFFLFLTHRMNLFYVEIDRTFNALSYQMME